MAAHSHSPGYPFASSFFSANRFTPSSALCHKTNIAPCAVENRVFGSHSSIVLHLNGQLETFCALGHVVLIRNCSDCEKAQLLTYHRELSVLVESMGRALSAAFRSK